MKKNLIKSFFSSIGRSISNFFMFLTYLFICFITKIFVKSKLIGKKKVSKTDEAQVFIANHYEIYGPIVTFLRFPFKFRPWVHNKMINPKEVEAHMSIGIYGKFPKYPMWMKKIAVKLLKNIMVYTLSKRAKGIAVYRDDPRANIKTMKESTLTLEQGKSILIFPEENYVDEGVGEFQTGFAHLAKYYYQKTGKKITFYPIFISQKNKRMYIEDSITFDPTNDPNEEKLRITNHLYNAMKDSYNKHEIQKENKKDA